MANKAQNDWMVGLGVAALKTAGQVVGAVAGVAPGAPKAADPWNPPAPDESWKKPNGNLIHDTVVGKGSDAQKAQILNKAGYCQFDVEISGTDYRGRPMDNFNVTVKLKAAGFDEGFTIGTMSDGAFIKKGIWAGREGIAHIDALNMDERIDIETPHFPSGVVNYKVDKGKLKLNIKQEYDEVDIGDTASHQTDERYGHGTQLEGGAEIDLGVGKIGDKGTETHTSEHGYSKGDSHSTGRKQRVPTNRLTVTQIS